MAFDECRKKKRREIDQALKEGKSLKTVEMVDVECPIWPFLLVDRVIYHHKDAYTLNKVNNKHVLKLSKVARSFYTSILQPIQALLTQAEVWLLQKVNFSAETDSWWRLSDGSKLH